MISIIGRGNVAEHLYKALKERNEVHLVNSHTLEDLPSESEIILIAVSDDAIEKVVENLPVSDVVVAHTSGSVDISVISKKFENAGVFYPLQTFTKGVELNYKEIPIFIEGANKNSYETLRKIASGISTDVREADSTDRRKLHLASVFACNFSNALADIAHIILEGTGIELSSLLPLMKQTVKKLENLSPEKAQTGPAVRNDKRVMDKHKEMLVDRPELKEIYILLSNYISSRHAEKL